MKRNSIKIMLFIILTIMLLPLLCEIYSYEVQAAEFDPNPYVENIKNDSTTGTDSINQIGRTIIGLLRGFGTIVSVAALIVIGIKYMIGSVEEKAQYKKTMMPYVIGAIIVFAITNLIAIIVEIAGAIK